MRKKYTLQIKDWNKETKQDEWKDVYTSDSREMVRLYWLKNVSPFVEHRVLRMQ